MVSQILIVDTVDFSTGNIDFPGSVHIQGNVPSGFTVKAAGDIVVQGVVENAVLIAGGNIALCRGVKGAGSGSLGAGQDIRTLFIESCQVRAGGSIYADTILNSDVACGHTVSVYGQRGYLLGGVCMAGDFVSAAQIGNAAQIATSVIIRSQPGQDPALTASPWDGWCCWRLWRIAAPCSTACTPPLTRWKPSVWRMATARFTTITIPSPMWPTAFPTIPGITGAWKRSCPLPTLP